MGRTEAASSLSLHPALLWGLLGLRRGLVPPPILGRGQVEPEMVLALWGWVEEGGLPPPGVLFEAPYATR